MGMVSRMAALVRTVLGMGGETVLLRVLGMFAARNSVVAIVLMPGVFAMALMAMQRLIVMSLVPRLPMFLGGSVVVLVLVHVDQR